MSLGAFAVVAARERELGVPVTLQNLAGFGWERPLLGVSMWIFLLGLLGFPLTGGFIGKFYVFAAAYEHGFWWLIVAGRDRDDDLGLLLPRRSSARCTSATPRSSSSRPQAGSPPRELLLGLGVLVCVAVTVGSFFAVQPLIDVARSAAARAAALEPATASRDAAPVAAGTGAAASASLSANTARQATSADAPSGGSVCV